MSRQNDLHKIEVCSMFSFQLTLKRESTFNWPPRAFDSSSLSSPPPLRLYMTLPPHHMGLVPNILFLNVALTNHHIKYEFVVETCLANVNES